MVYVYIFLLKDGYFLYLMTLFFEDFKQYSSSFNHLHWLIEIVFIIQITEIANSFDFHFVDMREFISSWNSVIKMV